MILNFKRGSLKDSIEVEVFPTSHIFLCSFSYYPSSQPHFWLKATVFFRIYWAWLWDDRSWAKKFQGVVVVIHHLIGAVMNHTGSATGSEKYHRSYYYHSTIVEFIDSKEIPGTPNSRTPTPMVLPYHSYKNPLKYGNGLEACGILLCIESWIEHPRPKIIHAWSFVPWKLPGSFLLVLGIFTTFLRKSLRGWSSHFWSSLCDCIPYSCDQKLFRNPAYGEAPLGWSVGKTFQCIGCLDPLEKVQICASYQIANWTNWTKCWTNSTWQLSDNNQLW